ncbi:hypothetical protein ACP70R_023957 [Stipagrostis hirtigluma subsp. patula]
MLTAERTHCEPPATPARSLRRSRNVHLFQSPAPPSMAGEDAERRRLSWVAARKAVEVRSSQADWAGLEAVVGHGRRRGGAARGVLPVRGTAPQLHSGVLRGAGTDSDDGFDDLGRMRRLPSSRIDNAAVHARMEIDEWLCLQAVNIAGANGKVQLLHSCPISLQLLHKDRDGASGWFEQLHTRTTMDTQLEFREGEHHT